MPDYIEWKEGQFMCGNKEGDSIDWYGADQAEGGTDRILMQYTEMRRKVEHDMQMCNDTGDVNDDEVITWGDIRKAVKQMTKPCRARVLMIPASACEAVSDAPEEVRESPTLLHHYLIERGYNCWFE